MKHIWYILLYVFQFSNLKSRKLRKSNMSLCILQWWDIYLIDLKASSTYVRGKVVYTCQNKIILLGIHKKYITFTAYLCAGLISFTQSIFASNSKIKVCTTYTTFHLQLWSHQEIDISEKLHCNHAPAVKQTKVILV